MLDKADRSPDFIAGLAKGLHVIECFGREKQRLTIADVARLTGFERASARRCLLTLVALGYAEQEGKQFLLTPRVLNLGYSYLSATPLAQLIQATLEDLAAKTEESCSATILDGTEIVYIARATQQRVMSVGLSLGSRLPAFCTSMGRVLLAALPEPECRALLTRSRRPQLTPKTVTDVDALMALIERVAIDGFSLVDQELEIGLKSLAVPVVNSRGKVQAALNIGVQATRLTDAELMADYLPRMRRAQTTLRAGLA